LIRNKLAGLVGANRPKVIAVFGTDCSEVDRAIHHARQTSKEASDLPIWAWCAEAADANPEGCDQFFSGKAGLSDFRRALRSVWVALSIVAWTGRRGLFRLPFRPSVYSS
jgi:hypothetical protein